MRPNGRASFPSAIAIAISIESLCTSAPTNAVLDFPMACLLCSVDTTLSFNVWFGARNRATHDTPAAGRLTALSHSV
jgi:hypothetical protein